jgi:hypothetical protein
LDEPWKIGVLVAVVVGSILIGLVVFLFCTPTGRKWLWWINRKAFDTRVTPASNTQVYTGAAPLMWGFQADPQHASYPDQHQSLSPSPLHVSAPDRVVPAPRSQVYTGAAAILWSIPAGPLPAPYCEQHQPPITGHPAGTGATDQHQQPHSTAIGYPMGYPEGALPLPLQQDRAATYLAHARPLQQPD